MPDLKKAIKGLKSCTVLDSCLKIKCPYGGAGCFEALRKDALTLLQEQEPVKVNPISINGNGVQSGKCPRCGDRINNYHNYKFCGECGQAVIWDD